MRMNCRLRTDKTDKSINGMRRSVKNKKKGKKDDTQR